MKPASGNPQTKLPGWSCAPAGPHILYELVILRADLKEKQRWRGPGGCGVFGDGGRDYIVYHAYDAWHHGIPTLRIAPLSWSRDGWPRAQSD